MKDLGSASPMDSLVGVSGPQREYHRYLITDPALARFQMDRTQQKDPLLIATVGRRTLTRGSDRELL